MSTLHEAKDILLEAAGTAEVIATAVGDNRTFPGGYAACYALKRLVDQAIECIEQFEEAAS